MKHACEGHHIVSITAASSAPTKARSTSASQLTSGFCPTCGADYEADMCIQATSQGDTDEGKVMRKHTSVTHSSLQL
ncbi:hypothetical protein CesoFtcFv8_012120 [Champsocephalus esox]|uniref:Uncharacterized protein n=1 Tax=Champsocephalus esox TaxID=159716 RepID=A0AAN8BWS2_9TELE|nr:hypothetical protein CesoFtcFv8_012120 [Champsocephalus esox]